jgi:hypothetical protein
MRILYRQKYNHADLLPAVPSVTTLNFRRPLSVTTFNFSVTTLSYTPLIEDLNQSTRLHSLIRLAPPNLSLDRDSNKQYIFREDPPDEIHAGWLM